MKGFVTYYIKIDLTTGLNLEEAIQQNVNFVRSFNKDVIERIQKDGYEMMFIPTYGESSHLEKTDLEIGE